MARTQVDVRRDVAEACKLIAAGSLPEAYELLSACMEQDDGDDGEATALLCRLALAVGDADIPEGRLAAGLRHDPSLAGEVIAFTTRLHGEGRTHECATLLARLAKADPENAEAWNDLGAARYALGEAEGAERCLRRAVALDPGYALARENLEAILLAQGR